MKNEKKCSRAHRILSILCAGMILSSGVCLYLGGRGSAEQKKLEEEIRTEAGVRETETEYPKEQERITPDFVEPEEEAPEKAYVPPVNFTSLQETNPDVIAWIRVPDTNIDYPVVWKEGDNEYYLHKDLKGNDSVYGTVYLDKSSAPDFSGKNHVFYGHHMKDGSMFRDVVKFKDPDFFAGHRYFSVYTPEREIHLKTLACYYGPADGDIRKTRFDSGAEFSSWLNGKLSNCSYVEYPEGIGSVYTLVTCSYEMKDARTYLFAAEVDENGNWVTSMGGR